jgi:serine/threonine protein kinase
MPSTLADFILLGTLGRGSFGVVHKVQRIADKRIYVMKQISIGELGRAEQQAAVGEVHLLASLDSPLITKYYDSFIDKGQLNLVMELCDRGDLQRLIRKQEGELLPEERICTWPLPQ